jgi:hypothetical protein
MRHWFLGLVVVSCVLLGLSSPARAADESGATTEKAMPPLPSSAPVYYEEPLPPPLPPRRRIKWGAEFRLEAAPFGSGAASNAGMGGFGMSFRPRPSPSFAVDIGVDFFGGRDFNGEKRGEQTFIVTPMLFVNPASRAVFYLFAGLGLASARVEHADGSQSHYGYLGANIGAGVEVPVWRRIAVDADVMAFVRDHTDSEIDVRPEFVEPGTGRYTNTSRGALFRLGLAYYW